MNRDSVLPECQFRRERICEVSTALASMPVPLNEKACAACSTQDTPQAVNHVTCSRAIHIILQAGLKPDSDLLRCVSAPSEGAGTEFERLVARIRVVARWVWMEWLFKRDSDCSCYAIRNQMNTVGITTCQDKIDGFSRAIVSDHAERFPWMKSIRWISVIVVKRLVKISIRNAIVRRKGGHCNANSR